MLLQPYRWPGESKFSLQLSSPKRRPQPKLHVVPSSFIRPPPIDYPHRPLQCNNAAACNPSIMSQTQADQTESIEPREVDQDGPKKVKSRRPASMSTPLLLTLRWSRTIADDRGWSIDTAFRQQRLKAWQYIPSPSHLV